MISILVNRVLWLVGVGLGRIGLGPIGFWPVLGALALAIVPAGIVWAKLSLSHAEEIGRVRGDERAACEVRIAEIAATINADAERKIAAAREAADAVRDATTDKEIEEACATDKDCREHGRGQE